MNRARRITKPMVQLEGMCILNQRYNSSKTSFSWNISLRVSFQALLHDIHYPCLAKTKEQPIITRGRYCKNILLILRSGEKALSGCHRCRFFWLLGLAFKDLNRRLLQYKATIKLLSHLSRDLRFAAALRYRRDPHRIVSLCLFQLLKHFWFDSYSDQLAITIKFKLLPTVLHSLYISRELITSLWSIPFCLL